MPSKAVLQCARALADKKHNIMFVESATAGRTCSEFALTPYSGAVLRGGIACYEVFIKENILKVSHALIKKFTPESPEVTKALAEQSAALFGADFTAAVTGLTTSGGSETPEKPVGTMFIHIVHPGGFVAHGEVFSGTPEEIILQVTDRIAGLVTEELNKQ